MNTLVSNYGNDISSKKEILKSPLRQGFMYIAFLWFCMVAEQMRGTTITSPCSPIAKTAIFHTEQFSVESIFPFIWKSNISKPCAGFEPVLWLPA